MTERDEHLRIIAAARDIIQEQRDGMAGDLRMPDGSLVDRGKDLCDDDALDDLAQIDDWLKLAEAALISRDSS